VERGTWVRVVISFVGRFVFFFAGVSKPLNCGLSRIGQLHLERNAGAARHYARGLVNRASSVTVRGLRVWRAMISRLCTNILCLISRWHSRSSDSNNSLIGLQQSRTRLYYKRSAVNNYAQVSREVAIHTVAQFGLLAALVFTSMFESLGNLNHCPSSRLTHQLQTSSQPTFVQVERG
jgi:hypothetical protein